MPDLVIVCPSRNRPASVAELALACQRTCTADTVLLVVIDLDDPKFSEYRAPAGTTVFFTHAPADSGHVAAINWGAARALADFKPFAIAKLDDDHRPRTTGWDTQLLDALREMGTGIAYGNDLIHGEGLPTAPAMTADIVRALGYMGPPVLRHLAVDNFWLELGRGAECIRYLPGVITEHLHPSVGKAEWDEGYLRANSQESYDRDLAAFEQYRRDELPAAIEAVWALGIWLATP